MCFSTAGSIGSGVVSGMHAIRRSTSKEIIVIFAFTRRIVYSPLKAYSFIVGMIKTGIEILDRIIFVDVLPRGQRFDACSPCEPSIIKSHLEPSAKSTVVIAGEPHESVARFVSRCFI